MRFFYAFILLLLLAGCDSSTAEFDLADYAGTYEGTRLRADRVAGTSAESCALITVSESSASTATLGIEERVDLDGQPQTGSGGCAGSEYVLKDEAFEGSYDASGARFVRDLGDRFSLAIEFGPDGEITGEGFDNVGGVEARIGVTGAITPDRLDLVYRFIVTRSESPAYEVGQEVLVVTYQAARADG